MKKQHIAYAIGGGSLIVIFLTLTNIFVLRHPDLTWILYPAYAMILWPVSVFFTRKGRYKVFSYLVSFILVLYLVIENMRTTPHYPWALYAVFPIIGWSVFTVLGRWARTYAASWIGSAVAILYYTGLNLFLEPGHPWAVYPAFVFLWWPLSMYYAKTKRHLEFSITASIYISAFFITVNTITTPHEIWAIYPIFAITWWPLSMYFYYYKRNVE